MKFRNYRNSFNNSNRIYSEDDIRNMTVQNLFDKEQDVLAQNRAIGLPTLDELQNSQNTQWVEPFVDDEGNDDGGYWQSIMDNAPIAHSQDFVSTENDTIPTSPYTLTGMVQENVIKPTQEAIDTEKEEVYPEYEGLTPGAARQKAITKNLPDVHLSAKEYYEHALKLADGEEPTEFMKENNNFRKIHEIADPNLKQIYIEKAAKMYGLDINDPATYDAVKNTDIVIPKIDSQLYSQVKNSKDFQRWVAKNYENIKNQTNRNESMKFSPEWGQYNLFATINNTDLKNSKINEDGSFSTIISDAYDFENWENQDWIHSDKNIKEKSKMFLSNRIVPTNNRAKEQQDLRQLQRYLLSTQINLSKEEVDEILRKYSHIK